MTFDTTWQALPQQALARLASRLDFGRLIDQRHRLLQVHTALPDLALVPERMVLQEALSQPFELRLMCLSASAHFELKRLIGEQITVKLLHSDGQYRPWHGYVAQAGQLGADGGLARYAITLVPWVYLASLRRNSRVFHDMTALQVIDTVLREHAPQAHWRNDVSDTLRLRSLCTQYQESDFAFVQRLMAEEGLVYHWEQLDDAQGASADNAGQARAVMVISCRQRQREARADLGELRFAGQHVTANKPGQRDSVTAFMAQRSLGPNAVSLGSWDYKRVAGVSAQADSPLSLGELPSLEVYDGSGAYRFEHPEHAQRAAEIALAALHSDTKRFEGQGSVRHLCAGGAFTLVDHPLYGGDTSALLGAASGGRVRGDNHFVVTAVEHHCANNLGSDAAEVLGSTDIEHGTYKNHFHAAPAAATLVPRLQRKPTAFGLQHALVVAAGSEPIETERDHRIKIRFPWQDASLGQGHHSAGDAPANAPGTWVRVALPWAGANWGAALVPRVGAEVAVEFVEGDIDRPLVVGVLYNGQDAPPFAAGEDSGVNHPGVLSGWHTHSLDGDGCNQWVLDDATAQLRMRLHCSYTLAEVGLGHLIGQGASGAQRGRYRGAGFEGNTQGWGALRAGSGLLISTSARAGSYGSAQGSQMDAHEATAQLKAARDLGTRLSDAASAQGAQALASHQAGQALEATTKAIDPTQDGQHKAALNGQAHTHDPQGNRTGSTPVSRFDQPHVVLDTPAALLQASDADLAQLAGQDLSWVAQGDVQHSAAHTSQLISAETTSLYTHQGGLQIKAANGRLSLRAHTDELKLQAQDAIQVLSVNGEIRIQAQSKIELIGADSSLVLEGGNITMSTPGSWAAKGAIKQMQGGGSKAAQLKALPSKLYGQPDKKITRLRWSYGPQEAALPSQSRHYVDLNLHVETQGYEAGESVDVQVGYPSTSGGEVYHTVSVALGPGGKGVAKNCMRSVLIGIDPV